MVRFAFTLFLLVLCNLGSAFAQTSALISIGTANIDGGYYSTSRALCEPINRSEKYTMRCSSEPTNGSIYNLIMLAQGELDFAIVQSDWQLAAYEGTGPFAGNPITDLRSVMSLYAETITILVGRDSGIQKAQDLKGMRLDIGVPSSGRHATAGSIFARAGVDMATFKTVVELTQDKSIISLCDGTIDASFFVLGHPSALVATALRECGARIISPNWVGIDEKLSSSTDFSTSVIHAKYYPELDQDVNTYAVYATLVTRSDTPFADVETLVNSTLQNLDVLTQEVSQLSEMTVQTMQTNGLSAPLHGAAANIYNR